MLGYYPFDADGNFYYATYTWTTVEGSPDPVAENSKIHVIDPGLNEIGTVYLDAGNKVALGAFVIDGTLRIDVEPDGHHRWWDISGCPRRLHHTRYLNTAS